MNLLKFAGAIVYHFFATLHVLRARTRTRGNGDGESSLLSGRGSAGPVLATLPHAAAEDKGRKNAKVVLWSFGKDSK